MNIVNIPLSKIVPDPEQPRKYFDETRMATLRQSIKDHGIISPLMLEINDDGTFLIIDGERRFRAATELKMKEVPAKIEPKNNEVSRTIRQFHLQEMHEGWTAVEKAVAISKLSEEMGVSQKELGKIIGIHDRTIGKYIAFGNIVDKKNYQKSNLSIDFAEAIVSLKNFIKRVMLSEGMEYDRNTEKKIENAAFVRIASGELSKPFEMTKIKDSIKTDPKILEKFLEDDTFTVEKMFTTTKAKGAYFLRNMRNNASYLKASIDNFNKDKSVKVDKDLITLLKLVSGKVDNFIKEFGE